MGGLFFFVGGLHAAEGAHTQVQLISENSFFQPGETAWLGLRLTMDPGWHTYWQFPGDSGLPTRATWTLPPGFSVGPLHWPFPERFEVPPLVNFGYGGETLLLVPLSVPIGAKTEATLSVRVDWLECAEVCVPGRSNLTLTVPVRSEKPTPGPVAALFQKFRARLPQAPRLAPIAYRQGKSIVLRIAGGKDGPVGFFPSGPDLLGSLRLPRMNSKGDDLELIFEAPDSLSARFEGVIVRGETAETVDIPWSPPPASSGFWGPLLLAFLGGILLNLMPCVLPVLSIKVFGFLKESSDRRRGESLWYGAGVLVSFWALAAALLALRAGGSRLGWGFQLQSPVVVFFLAVLFLGLALNFMGLFEVGTSFSRWGGMFSGQGPGNALGSGVLAAVVATPCTAPFMGTALGYAVTQPAPVALGVFTALGFGMAFPYVLLAHAPFLGRWLPKPGPWMDHLKKGLGGLLLGTTLWLMWVLRKQGAGDAALVPLGLFFLFFLFYAGGQRGRRPRWAFWAVAWLSVAGGTVLGLRLKAGPPAALSESHWESFSEERWAETLTAGRPVFVDFTAAWCLTCQVNERTTLGDPRVLETFQKKNIRLLRADWTQRDPAITAALERRGRSGVPLYVLQFPGRTERLLPALLTPKLLISELEKEAS